MKYSLNILFIAVFFSVTQTLRAQDSNTDEYWQTSQGNYEKRRTEFLDYCIKNGDRKDLRGIYTQVARVVAGLKPDESYVQEALNVIKSNHDCNDFVMNGLLRLQYQKTKNAQLSKEMAKKVEERILDFKYWWTDSRRDTTYRCYHTENHQALYHTAELLAGQLYKDRRFSGGLTGREHIHQAERLLQRWLDFRFRFGFSEWMSSYYEVDIVVLLNLYDYAENPMLRQRAKQVLDLLMFDMALSNYHGSLASTSGRMYVSSLLYGHHDMSPTLKLVFGEGQYHPRNIMSNVALASSHYKCPQVILDIATDYSKTMLDRQKMSIEVDDAEKYGLRYDNEEDAQLFWGMQEFIHPKVVRMSKQVSEKYGVYPYRNYDDYIRKYDDQVKQYGKVINSRLDRFALSETNIEIYRTPEYALSCSFDYRKGAQGYQQHIWQATLDNKAIVFTTHPGKKDLKVTPNYWAGNAVMPRAVQYRNVAVCIYNSHGNGGLDLTHAYFPKQAFDEVVEVSSWVFARKGKGYIALRSQLPTSWQADDNGNVNDIVASGRQNIWICEMGSEKEWGSFQSFVKAISQATVKYDHLNVTYTSPTLGQMDFGWDSAFKLKNKEIPLKTDYRYDNPYCQAKFNSKLIEIKKGGKKLLLDFEKGIETEK